MKPIGSFHVPAVDEIVQEMLVKEPAQATALILLNIFGSTALIRFCLGNVLDFGRFRSFRVRRNMGKVE